MYWKTPLYVPEGIRYLSQWNNFSLTNYIGHNIIHKQIPGCGFTEFALTCPEPVVLSSPRKMLMENKKEQHGDDVLLIKSLFDRELDIDSDMSKEKSQSAVEKSVEEENLYIDLISKNEKSFYTTLFNEIDQYIYKITSESKAPKIIVTYDSTHLVKRVLEQMGILNNFWFVVDEFQSILEDARFKAGTELEFLTVTLQQIPNVLYISATPMLDRYIEQIPQFNIPYYQLDWEKLDPLRVKKPDLKIRSMKSVKSKMKEIIKSYLEGKFEKAIVDRGNGLEEVESRECVIYINSVNHIINILNDPELIELGLSFKNVNILCSNTSENQRKIDKRLGKKSGYKIGSVPLRGELHKMFTLCTRTVYLGADFYSTNARSFIFSDANADSLSVDISMDLAQILGRQRLDINPWKNSAEFYYRVTCDYKKMTWEDLKKIIKEKEDKTNSLIRSYERSLPGDKNNLAEKYLYVVRSLRYKDDYLAINKTEDGSLYPITNMLVRINEERSFDIQQVDYANRFSVFCSIEREFGTGQNLIENFIKQFFYEYDLIETYLDKIKMICEFLIEYPQLYEPIINNLADSDKIKQQLVTLGPERIKGLGYHITKIKEAMGVTIFDRTTLDSIIYKNFLVGERYSKKYIKEKLTEIYLKADFHGTAKANDLENWFEIKDMKITIDGKQQAGFEIISIRIL